MVSQLQADLQQTHLKYPKLSWIDAASGSVLTTCELTDLKSEQPRYGPMRLVDEKIWAFADNGQNTAERHLVRLNPKDESAKSIVFKNDAWNDHIRLKLRREAHRALPGWRLDAAQDTDRTGLLADGRGQKEVFGLRIREHEPIVLTFGTPLAAGKKTSASHKGRTRQRSQMGSHFAFEWREIQDV